MVGDSLLKHLGNQFVDWEDVWVKSYRGYHVEDLTSVFVEHFDENEWTDVGGIALLIGTNDIESESPEAFRVQYRALIRFIRARLGDIPIVLFGIPPRPKDHEDLGHKAIHFNKIVKEIAVELGVCHHPLYKAFLSYGQPKSHMFLSDGLHLAYPAEVLLAKVVKMFRTQFLG